MDILEKISETMKLNEEKKNNFQTLMYLVAREWKEFDSHFLQMQNYFKECFNGLQSKEENLKLVQESVRQGMKKLDARKLWVELWFKELGVKEKLMKELLQRMEEKEMQLEKFKEFVDEKMEDLVVKEKHFHGLLGEFKVFQDQMERREIEIVEKEKRLAKLKDELEAKEEILELKMELFSISESDDEEDAPPLKRCSRKVLDADKKGIILSEETSHLPKRSCRDGKDAGLGESGSGLVDKKQVKAKGYCIQNVIVIDDSDSDTDAKDNVVSKTIDNPVSFCDGIEVEKVVNRFKCGQTWACYDGKDVIPRAYAQIMTVSENGGIARFGVAWLKPVWVFPGENKWISAGLPVGCGMFERGSTSVETATAFAHQVCCLQKGQNRYCILPGSGETWAIYKDWDLFAWAYDSEKHRQCKYEIVEVLRYHTNGSSLFDIRVVYLDKMGGSVNSFQRRIQDEDGSFLIKSSNLYRFSHRVLSVRKACDGVSDVTFDIELYSLPPGF